MIGQNSFSNFADVSFVVCFFLHFKGSLDQIEGGNSLLRNWMRSSVQYRDGDTKYFIPFMKPGTLVRSISNLIYCLLVDPSTVR